MNCDIVVTVVDNINNNGVASASCDGWTRESSVNGQDVLAIA